jgi:hypothetical protein
MGFCINVGLMIRYFDLDNNCYVAVWVVLVGWGVMGLLLCAF